MVQEPADPTQGSRVQSEGAEEQQDPPWALDTPAQGSLEESSGLTRGRRQVGHGWLSGGGDSRDQPSTRGEADSPPEACGNHGFSLAHVPDNQASQKPSRPAEPGRALQGHPRCPLGQCTKGAHALQDSVGLVLALLTGVMFLRPGKSNQTPYRLISVPREESRACILFQEKSYPHTSPFVLYMGGAPWG